jgi:hypothetical protein
MAKPSSVDPVKLFVVTIHSELQAVQRAIDELKKTWGGVDYTSPDYPFVCTDYYENEMGAGLLRRFYSFRELIPPDRIVEVKLDSNRIEDELAQDGKRTVNLDPGYIDTYKVVLPSMKFGGQKVYLREGVYADMTLVMYKGKWQSFAWGFPDFKSGSYDSVLSHIRSLFKEQRKRPHA